MKNRYEVLVVGGGHAGIEAAYAAAKMGAQTLLLTLSKDTIGLMPCNPSIGGLGKSHIVYEVSALGGLMPQLCSQTYLQARMLNTSKGPAVQGLRLQIDKYAYKKLAEKTLQETDNLTIVEGMVIGVLIDREGSKKKIIGVCTRGGHNFYASCVIVTAGTFLNGRVHVGLKNHEAGRMGEEAVQDLSFSLQKLMGIQLGRLKTGTPPRLLRDSIDFSQLEYQQSHNLDYLFEFKHTQTSEKMPVYIAHTNENTHKIIADNLEKSGMYSGNITGIGPRYCPSIEDKIGRFPHRNSHHVFVEPEGEENGEVYPAGLSTSLPLDVQEAYIHSIKGFERAVISKPGYAVEYDFVQPRHLKPTLETKTIKGLFFAGQVNGTTGYEEAAGQGIIAGINAVLKGRRKKPFILNRSESYIGVMVDDLITLGVDEPYRMFTSRAEHRLLLRQDNVFNRLIGYGRKLGLVDSKIYDAFLIEQNAVKAGLSLARQDKSSPLYKLFHMVEFTDQVKKSIREQLVKDLNISFSSRALLSMHAEMRYEGYLQRELREIEKLKKYQSMILPVTMVYENMPGLSIEIQQKLMRYKPQTIAQAQRIPGMTPAALSLLIFQVKLIERHPAE